jgi:PKD repeat protein
MRKIVFLLILNLLICSITAFTQISKGGLPKSFSYDRLNVGFQKVELFADLSQVTYEEKSYTDDVIPHKIGFTIKTDYNLMNSGSWFTLDNGDKIWKLSIRSADAEALSIYFKDFLLPEGAKLFLYNADKTQVIGAFTNDNNRKDGFFATELIRGEIVILEYSVSEKNSNTKPFTITEVGYVYRDSGFDSATLKSFGFGDSDDCEVNINCPEGQNWQQQKKGVARIQVKKGNSLFLCTGTLINNTGFDLAPYFLTANHCGNGASAEDYAKWIFYFNYESDDCDNPQNEPDYNTMTGAILKASGNIKLGSDFKLLLLKKRVPDEYDPYFNGWDRNLIASNSGVCIHHPSGDIKKISTYNEPLISANYNSSIRDPNARFWRVIWSATISGHGVTEKGSSGSPLFNPEGRIVGVLAGGGSSCRNFNKPDYYGKFSYSWASNGTKKNQQLKVWLDPKNSGISKIAGVSPNEVLFIPNFKADTTHVPIGGSLTFTDISIGFPKIWKWTFEGGVPNTSNSQSPQPVKYNKLGFYDVKLVIRDDLRVDSLIMKDYVKVIPIVGPTPTKDKINIYWGTTPRKDVILTLFDESGREVEKYMPEAPLKSMIIDVSKHSAGYYFLRIQWPNYIQMYKVVIL